MDFFLELAAFRPRLGQLGRRVGPAVCLLATTVALGAVSDGGSGAATPADATAALPPITAAAPDSTAIAPAGPTPPLTKVVEDSPGITSVERTNFTIVYPSNWKEDVGGQNYDPNTNFTLVSPKNSYIQFTLLPAATTSPAKIVSDTVKRLDGPAITVLSKTKIEEWGGYKGQGYHLKGKIVGSFPGGIKVFVLVSKHFNVLIVENYFSDELRDVQDDFDTISKKFVMKN